MATKLAWLAGFWDGEGSVGLINNKKTKILLAQLSHTERDSVIEILSILRDYEIGGRGYTYQERDPNKHRDAHYIRVSGVGNIRKLAILLEPWAITKKRHWQIAIAWADSRIKVAGGLDPKGNLKRGGIPGWNPYTKEEMDLATELTRLNKRGPDDSLRKTFREGRISVPGLCRPIGPDVQNTGECL